MCGYIRSICFCLVLAGLLGGCNHPSIMAAKASARLGSQNAVPVSYQQASNYFIKNTVTESVPRHITSAEVFARYFSVAATMGEAGKPTPIDFTTQDVLVFDVGIVQQQLDIRPLILKLIQDRLVLNLRIRSGAELDYQMRAFVLLIVPKGLPDRVEFNVQSD
ncbi:hypothetical protein BHC46_06120 [Snodgrassella alvi]|uniref:Lipoprotein n=1 Tax=Snodgrassella alvi TaxID=1196083 RepID=A0A2N9XHQ0_9NEIS|nr:hypothetical protein [Snodgrassella alvi]PIT47855.1 hypothetical protein BHC46_06120 [Snodgrassella alvi]